MGMRGCIALLLLAYRAAGITQLFPKNSPSPPRGATQGDILPFAKIPTGPKEGEEISKQPFLRVYKRPKEARRPKGHLACIGCPNPYARKVKDGKSDQIFPEIRRINFPRQVPAISFLPSKFGWFTLPSEELAGSKDPLTEARVPKQQSYFLSPNFGNINGVEGASKYPALRPTDYFTGTLDPHMAFPIPGRYDLSETSNPVVGLDGPRTAPDAEKRKVSAFLLHGLMFGLIISALRVLVAYRRGSNLFGLANKTAYRWGLAPVTAPVQTDFGRIGSDYEDSIFAVSSDALMLPPELIYDTRRVPWHVAK
jgi:hypothetical protein